MPEKVVVHDCYFCKNDDMDICGGGVVWYVSCPTCGAEGPIAQSKGRAVTAWNSAHIGKLPGKDGK